MSTESHLTVSGSLGPLLIGLILASWVLNTLRIVVLSSGAYTYMVTDFMDPLALSKPTWAFLPTSAVIMAISNGAVRIVFCYRIWRFSGHNFWLALLIALPVLTTTGTTLGEFLLPSAYEFAPPDLIQLEAYSVVAGLEFSPGNTQRTHLPSEERSVLEYGSTRHVVLFANTPMRASQGPVAPISETLHLEYLFAVLMDTEPEALDLTMTIALLEHAWPDFVTDLTKAGTTLFTSLTLAVSVGPLGAEEDEDFDTHISKRRGRARRFLRSRRFGTRGHMTPQTPRRIGRASICLCIASPLARALTSGDIHLALTMAPENGFTIKDSLGPLLIGLILASCLYGVTTVQTYIYFIRGSVDDKKFMKCLVFFLWVLNTLRIVTLSSAAYTYMMGTGNAGISWAQAFQFAPVAVALPAPCTRVATQLDALIALSHRAVLVAILPTSTVILAINNGAVRTIWRFSGNNVWLTLPIALTIFATTGTALAYSVVCGNLPSWSSLAEYAWLLSWAFASSITSDLLICASVCVLLSKRKTGYTTSGTIVRKLIMYAVSTGLLSS
ncbi:hypothetical protein VTO73DRAFT_1283 [Trametes versicolor]